MDQLGHSYSSGKFSVDKYADLRTPRTEIELIMGHQISVDTKEKKERLEKTLWGLSGIMNV